MYKVWPRPYTKKEAARYEKEDETADEMFDAAYTDDEEPQPEPEEGKKRKKRRIKYKAKKLVLNTRETNYHIIRYVGKTVFNMRLSNFKTLGPDKPTEQQEWDLLWTDDGVTVDRLYKMKPF